MKVNSSLQICLPVASGKTDFLFTKIAINTQSMSFKHTCTVVLKDGHLLVQKTTFKTVVKEVFGKKALCDSS